MTLSRFRYSPPFRTSPSSVSSKHNNRNTPTLVSSTFDLSFFVWNEPSNSLDLKQVTLSFPSNPSAILKSAESQFSSVVNIAELKEFPLSSPPPSSAPSKTLPNGRRQDEGNGKLNPQPQSAPSTASHYKPKTGRRSKSISKEEMKKIKKRFDSAMDEMSEILSTGAHLDPLLSNPKSFTASSDPSKVSVKQNAIRRILLNVRQIPSSDSDSPTMSPPPTEILDRIASVLHHELMVPSPPMMSPSGHYIRTLRDALLQDGKKWRVFEEMLITVGPDDYDDVSVDELPEDLTWFGWDFSFVKRPTEIDDEDSTASKTDHKSIYKIFNAPVTSPETLYVLVPPDFEKGDLLTFLESIFEGKNREKAIPCSIQTLTQPLFPCSLCPKLD